MGRQPFNPPPALLALLPAMLALCLYLLTLTDVHTYDALSYILDVDRKPWRELFHPHHLAYGPLGAVIRAGAAAFGWTGSVEKLLQLSNALAGAVGVALFATVVGRAAERPWAGWLASLLLGSSYAYWYYAVEVEVYTIAALFLILALGLMLALLRAPSPRLALGLGAAQGCAVLFHQTNVLLCVPALVAITLGAQQAGAGARARPPFTLLAAYLVPLGLIVGGAYLGVGIGVSGFRSWELLRDWAAGYTATGYWGGAVDGAKLSLLAQGLAESIAQPGGGLLGAALLAVALLRWRVLAAAPRGTLAVAGSWLAVYGAFFLWWEPDNIEFWIASLPPFYLLVLLAAAGPAGDGRRPAGSSWWAAGVVLICGLVMLDLNFISIAARGDAERDLQRSAAAAVADASAPGDLIIAEDGLPELYLPFYEARPNVYSLSQAMAAAGSWEPACALIRTRIEAALAGGYGVLIADAAQRPPPAPPGEPPTPAERLGLAPATVAACYAPFEPALSPVPLAAGLPGYTQIPAAQALADGAGWDFARGRWGWRAGNAEPAVGEMGWTIRPGSDPFVVSPPLQIDTARFGAIELRLAASTAARDAQLFLLDANGQADERRSLRWTLRPGPETQSYILNLGDAPGWHSVVTGLRLDPVSTGDGGTVTIESIRLLP